jgi:hypothetical protein
MESVVLASDLGTIAGQSLMVMSSLVLGVIALWKMV